MSSIFSKIIAREIPARIVYEDAHVIAFLDLHPVNPGHTLVVPKQEHPNILTSSEEDLMHVLRAVRLLAPSIMQTVDAQGFTLSVNTGEASGQTVFHTHVHIIPRFSNDGQVSWGHRPMSDEQMDALKEAIVARISV